MLKELLKSGTKVSIYYSYYIYIYIYIYVLKSFVCCLHTIQALDPLIKYFTAKLIDLQPKLLVAVLQR